ncbi:hypothetical protein HQ535_13075 [bacterium]|nr:hypothetical protein [bacterium]
MIRGESGQTTAEYALVIVAAAVVALALIAWASDTDILPQFFESVVRRVKGLVQASG